MPSTLSDLRIANAFAKRIVAAGCGRVRRVVMVGSRALGTARADSDLDIVVLVEIPANTRPWGTADCATERDRLQREVGAPPLPTDLWVRTTDQYQEARGVAGTVESLVDTEGVDVYAEPFQRPPRIRRTPSQVRREYAVGWVAHALLALEAAHALRTKPVAFRAGLTPQLPDVPARACVSRALLGLTIARQVPSAKGDDIEVILDRYAAVDGPAAEAIRKHLNGDAPLVTKAHAVLTTAVRQLMLDAGTSSELRRVQAALVKLAGSTAHSG